MEKVTMVRKRIQVRKKIYTVIKEQIQQAQTQVALTGYFKIK